MPSEIKIPLGPWKRVEPLGEHHDKTAFSCGQVAIDHWLHDEALNQQRQGNISVWVCVGEQDRLCAFFASRVHVLSVPTSLSSTRRKYWGVNERGFAPAFMIAKLGLDRALQGRGYGKVLLHEALRKCVEAADRAACKLIVVDALDDRLVSFYENQGFVPIEGRRLILSVKAVRKSLRPLA